jgi:hypothetical protein
MKKYLWHLSNNNNKIIIMGSFDEIWHFMANSATTVLEKAKLSL